MKINRIRLLGFAGIEFVIVLPILAIFIFSIIDFGRLLFQYNTLTKTARDATRYLAAVTRPPLYGSDADYTNAVSQVSNLALCGKLTGCTTPLVPGLNSSNIAIDYPTSGIAGVTLCRVTISGYNTSFLTSVFPNATKDLGTISVTMRQVQQ
ncbi:MAG TPA: TadE family protein [Methylophilaceae bacterium]|nr:TadE family protein [Methylophilaceae bacterium]